MKVKGDRCLIPWAPLQLHSWKDNICIYCEGEIMGWDAYSSDFWIPEGDEKEHPVFARMARRIAKEYGTVDALLQFGGLDVSSCGAMLERATGQSVHAETWNADEVFIFRENADWDFEVEEKIAWTKGSAQAFLNICADLNLSIRFSW